MDKFFIEDFDLQFMELRYTSCMNLEFRNAHILDEWPQQKNMRVTGGRREQIPPISGQGHETLTKYRDTL